MKAIAALVLLAGFTVALSQTTVEADGKLIWLNGINQPWISWSDFDTPWGGNNYDASKFEAAFTKYEADGINAVRVWVHCKGEGSPLLDASGAVTGVPEVFWSNLDDMLQRAANHGLYIMPALFSFDVLKRNKVSNYPYQTAEHFKKLITSSTNTQTYIDSVLVPLVERYKDNPHLLAWEICNEPEWMVEGNGEIDAANQVSWEQLQRFHAQLAAAVNEHAATPVTTGAASIKWNWDNPSGSEVNRWSDAALQAQYDDPDAYLDWYQVHFYDWMIGQGWHYNPYVKGPDEWGIGDRPVIIGETPGTDVSKLDFSMTLTEMYEAALAQGYAGVFGWSDQANDGHGTYAAISAATAAFAAAHPSLVEGVAVGVRRTTAPGPKAVQRPLGCMRFRLDGSRVADGEARSRGVMVVPSDRSAVVEAGPY